VFRVGADGLELIEIAPGLDAERDVIAQMGFRPRVARELKGMDSAIFAPGSMNLAAHVRGKPPRYRTPRVAQWYESRGAAR